MHAVWHCAGLGAMVLHEQGTPVTENRINFVITGCIF